MKTQNPVLIKDVLSSDPYIVQSEENGKVIRTLVTEEVIVQSRLTKTVIIEENELKKVCEDLGIGYNGA